MGLELERLNAQFFFGHTFSDFLLWAPANRHDLVFGIHALSDQYTLYVGPLTFLGFLFTWASHIISCDSLQGLRLSNCQQN
jgi:hypothetical protein